MLPTYALANVMHLPSDSKSAQTPDGSPTPAQHVLSVKTSGSLATQTVECLSNPPTSTGYTSIINPQSNATASNGGPSNGFISSARGSYTTIPGTNGIPSNGTALHSGNGSNGQSVHNSSATNGHPVLTQGNSAAPGANLCTSQHTVPTTDNRRCDDHDSSGTTMEFSLG